MTAGRRGLALTPMETREDVILRTARLADELGYEVFAVPEAWSLDPTALIARMASETRQINLMAGVLSIWGRTPATLAMTAATLYRACEGRFILGLGVSTPAIVEGFHRIRFERPAARLSAVAGEVRNLLDGGRARIDPASAARPLAMGAAPVPGLPIWIAAIGDRTTAVAGELADGWFPVFQTRASLAERAAQFTRPLTVAAGPLTIATADPDVAREIAAGTLAWYLCAMGTYYAATATAQGHGTAVQAIQAANVRPDPRTGVVPEEAQTLLDEFAVYGTPEQVRAGLACWDGVVDVTMLGLSPGLTWEQIESTVRAGAPS